jgi:hypothetical protein
MMNYYHKKQVLQAKRTLDFIRQFPNGVTREDFEKAGLPILGIERLMKARLIIGSQIKEPERGTRAYHWLWKVNPNQDEWFTKTEFLFKSEEK